MSSAEIDAMLDQANDLDDALFGETFYCERLSGEFIGKVEDVPLEFQASLNAQMRVEITRRTMPYPLVRRDRIVRLKNGTVLTVVSCTPSDADWLVLVTE